MPILSLLYLVALVACCGYAFLRGGGPERFGAAIISIGSVLTYLAMSNAATNYRSVEFDAFVIDVLCLLAFVVLALRANRYWPLWVAALQIIGLGGHFVKLAEPGTLRQAYGFALVFWSYPMLLLIALGTFNHQRRLRRFGSDPSWSSSSGRSAPPTAPTR
jgi:nicotinamide riboside transporter PnuC